MTHETLRMLATGTASAVIYAFGITLAVMINGGPVIRPALAGISAPARRPHRSTGRHAAPGTAKRVRVFGGAHRAR
jgi:hypothetical protein